MNRRRRTKTTVIIRLTLSLTLIITGVLLGLTGILMWLSPTGQHSGSTILFLGLSKDEMGDVHFYLSMITMFVALAHIVLSWKIIRGYFRYLIKTR